MKRRTLLAVLCLTTPLWVSAKPGQDNTQSAEIHTQLGSVYYAEGNLVYALREFATAIQEDPQYAKAHIGMGLVRASLKQPQEAEASFKRAMSIGGSSKSEAENNYGVFLCSINRIDESIKLFDSAARDPMYDTPDLAYMNAALCALKKADHVTAERYLEKVLLLNPNVTQAAYEMARVHYARGNYPAAQQWLTQLESRTTLTQPMLEFAISLAKSMNEPAKASDYRVKLTKLQANLKTPNSPSPKE